MTPRAPPRAQRVPLEDRSRRIDAKGRILIPPATLRTLGWKFGDRITVEIDGRTLRVLRVAEVVER